MPTYNFKCVNCGHVSKVSMTIEEYDKQKTVICGRCGDVMERLYGKMDFVLRGGGFYSKK
jgi:putative FmdB family regulatory protein